MTAHPAKFSKELMPVLAKSLIGCRRVVDPFAGTGRIHTLNGMTVDIGEDYAKKCPQKTSHPVTLNLQVTAIELEPEWVTHHPTIIGDAFDVLEQFMDGYFDAVCTSPTYGNRMADKHDAKDESRRNTYTHTLGRPLSTGNSGGLQWGGEYRDFHRKAWVLAFRKIRPGGRLILNIKDHIRRGEIVPVTQWHIDCLVELGFMLGRNTQITTPGNRFGENSGARVDHESVIVFFKPISGAAIALNTKDSDWRFAS